MTRAFFNVILAALIIFGLLRAPAYAALMADPQKLYDEMRAAYDKGNTQGWSFYSQEYYLASIFDAGRAYSLQRPNDPNYAELADLAVRIGSSVHYDPLLNHDAVPWYVNEAAHYVALHDQDPMMIPKATALIERVAAQSQPATLARYADEDANANFMRYPHDVFAMLQRVEADWRGYLITNDPAWRSLAFARADEPDFPIAQLPSTWGPGFVSALKSAVHGAQGYTIADKTAATAVLNRLSKVDPMMVIAKVTSHTHEAMMNMLAPADEYFGPMGMSILGIRNELKRVNQYLAAGWGNRESGDAVQVAVAVDDLHKVYPRDIDLPQMLLEVYDLLGKITTPDAKAAQDHMRAILTVEYQDSPQAQKLLL